MQNTVLDSTIPTLNQDKSSVEYIEPQDDPIATIQTDVESRTKLSDTSLFDFHAVHNGEACIESLRPEDRGTERQFWFTVAMMCVIYGVAERTLRDNIESLIEDGELVSAEIRRDASVLDINGVPHKTAIYNLEVLNKLGMCCFRGNKKAKEIRDKFNDVLVERETGGYGIRTVDDMINDPDTAIRLLTQLKIMRLQNKQLEMERDEAIRTKAEIGSKREAKAMNTASQKSKECEKLREQIGDSKTYKAAKSIPWLSEYFDTRNRGLYNSLAYKLKKIEAGMPDKFAHIMIDDSQYGEIKAYHVAVIERLHEMVQADEEFMKDYRKDVSPKTKNA